MKMHKMTIFIESLNAVTPVSLINGEPDFSGFSEPTLSILREAYEAAKDNIEIIPDPILEPVILPPDWKELLQELLIGSLNPIFRKITLEAISNPAALLARQDIYGAISNPDISDRISALRAGLDMLEAAMPLTQSDRNLWNSTISNLNFPDEVKL